MSKKWLSPWAKRIDNLRTALENKLEEYAEIIDNESDEKKKEAMETEYSYLEEAQSSLEILVSDLENA